MKVLFVNHKERSCGVYQFGKRVFDLVKESKSVNYKYIEVDNENDFFSYRLDFQPDFILYNWHPITMGWLSDEIISNYEQSKHFFLYHEGGTRNVFDKYLFFGGIGRDTFVDKNKLVILPRPLLKYDRGYKENSLPTIGSFGFGGWHKGFTTLVEMVNKEFDSAIINIHMPFAFYGDSQGDETLKIAAECRRLNINEKITLNISHEFLTNDGILDFLSGNDLNVFLYRVANQGLSSVIDYALSVKRPIAITDNMMFRHIIKDEISVENNSLKDIMALGTKPLEYLYSRYDIDNFKDTMDKLFNEQLY